MTPICLVNGLEGAALDPLDRGLQYGDGVFRTLRVDNGKPRWWDEQLAKLATDASHLAMAWPEASAWRADLANLAGRLSGGVLKLLLTRGSAARGYHPPKAASPTRILIYDPTPLMSDAWPSAGLNVRICDLRLGAQPRLAGIKHLNRLENVMARAEWSDPDTHEGLLRDEAGRVISGVMSNVFLWQGGCLRTPRLDRCGVAGVTRARLLARAATAGYRVEQCELDRDDVLAAEEIMLTNSLIGLRRVACLAERTWPEPVVSPRLKFLLDA
ncbi:MAG: aminodeoxychorismate lyase [Hydrogenophilales bacterium CG17_big_fil_post_rev_8_21_14_2_50_63_12]|nr:MAG: aminodeoxychorismate lyase [Hydrogenophilales bacterium CG17_big_fil_post_rev_8_21_14_2_50_63_12]PIX97263.1 MAG: aminodeoxychorismate lyase [Hydrogenophilales bacterium CG_4_10_14_3_um_filter_63_21]PJB06861.1 MAG: aminodeoxychorismate lyase [Hydrogenophilales bacterium CG_4_9_14_3_um_filter_63_34]